MRRNFAFRFVVLAFCFVFLFSPVVFATDDPAAKPAPKAGKRRAPVLKAFKKSVDQDEKLKKKLLTGTRQENYELIISSTNLANRPRIDKYLQDLTDDQFARLMTLFVESPDFKSFRQSFRKELPPLRKNMRRRDGRRRYNRAKSAPRTDVGENDGNVRSD